MSKQIQTPWGKAQDFIQHRKGFYFYETASHGGYHLSPHYNKMIPQKFLNQDGWYEEDSEALKVEYFLADIVQPICIDYVREELEYYLNTKIKD